MYYSFLKDYALYQPPIRKNGRHRAYFVFQALCKDHTYKLTAYVHPESGRVSKEKLLENGWLNLKKDLEKSQITYKDKIIPVYGVSPIADIPKEYIGYLEFFKRSLNNG